MALKYTQRRPGNGSHDGPSWPEPWSVNTGPNASASAITAIVTATSTTPRKARSFLAETIATIARSDTISPGNAAIPTFPVESEVGPQTASHDGTRTRFARGSE